MLTTGGAFLFAIAAFATPKRDLYVPGAGELDNSFHFGLGAKNKLKTAICMSLWLYASKICVFGVRAKDLGKRGERGLQQLHTC